MRTSQWACAYQNGNAPRSGDTPVLAASGGFPGRIRIRSGVSLIMLVLIFVILIAFVAFAVDVGYVSLTRAQLQATIDAATLAGASGLPVSAAEARQRAKDIAASNRVNGQPLTLLDSDIELGTWNRSSRSFVKLTGANESSATAIRVSAELSTTRGNPVRHTFARILGFESTNLAASSTGGFGLAADVALVQDITTSFKDELGDAKTGDQALLDALYANGNGRSSFGIVVHTGWGKTLAPLQAIDSNYTSLSNIISSIKVAGSTGMPVPSGTDIASGLAQGLAEFNNPSYHPNPNTVKAMVLVSDGSPSASSAGSHPTMDAGQLLAEAVRVANDAWSQRIHVYVVFFNQDNDPVAADNLRSLTRGSGVFVQVTDPKDLPAALERITQRLPIALLK